MSRTRRIAARTGVATLLGLAACLVVWWPQGAVGQVAKSGRDGVAVASSYALRATPTAPTRSPTPNPSPGTPMPSNTPTAPTAPTGPNQPTPAQPTQPSPVQPTHAEPQSGPGPKEAKGPKGDQGPKNDGATVQSHHGAGSNDQPAPQAATSRPTYRPSPAAPPAPATLPTTAAQPATPEPAKPAPAKAGGSPVAEASPAVATEAESAAAVQPDASETYLTSSAPAETASVPVWVIPGILLVITSLTALLGGLLGRNRSAPGAPGT